VDEELRFLAQLVADRCQRLLGKLDSERAGRGYSLVSVVRNICSRILKDGEAIAVALPITDPTLAALKSRELARLRQELDLLHEVVAHFHGDIGRTDLPVGLLHLVDELIFDLLPAGADPILHLDDPNMYSTLPLLQVLAGVVGGDVPGKPHPVAFNLPAIDPGNATLAPILAHEVGHTAWIQGLKQEVDAKSDFPAISARLRQAVVDDPSIDALKLAQTFDDWRQEILCDSLATALSGPSFLFASAVFLPIPTVTRLGSHPPPRDRVALTLRQLDSWGWTATLGKLAPEVTNWCRSLAAAQPASVSPAEAALRDAMALLEPTLTEVAQKTVRRALQPNDLNNVEAELFGQLALEIPPVEIGRSVSSPWLIIAGGWLFELQRRGDSPSALAAISADARLNRFLIKTVELSGVARMWGET
jgi:hypothetical protein